ncbi:hypothetical protein BGZ63DRAFT_465613 [Mariannaea sp. PMI_226]|nr:hypothetical protein BGZ63DRAFT_465613 [Mariannaea sp. PMI_226]
MKIFSLVTLINLAISTEAGKVLQSRKVQLCVNGLCPAGQRCVEKANPPHCVNDPHAPNCYTDGAACLTTADCCNIGNGVTCNGGCLVPELVSKIAALDTLASLMFCVATWLCTRRAKGLLQPWCPLRSKDLHIVSYG